MPMLKDTPARQDGRPQYYDIASVDRVQCYHCLRRGLESQYGRGEGMMADPANPPAGRHEIGSVYTVCVNDLPDDAVIYDPVTNTCRNKSGDDTWTEA